MLLTNDQFLPREQDPGRYGIGLVVLTTNRLRVVERLVPEIAEALARVSPGETIGVLTKHP